MLPSNWNFTEEGKIHFAGKSAPLRKNDYAFCQVGSFWHDYLIFSMFFAVVFVLFFFAIFDRSQGDMTSLI